MVLYPVAVRQFIPYEHYLSTLKIDTELYRLHIKQPSYANEKATVCVKITYI